MQTSSQQLSPEKRINSANRRRAALSSADCSLKRICEVVYLVSDSPCVLEALSVLREEAGTEVVDFKSAHQFLEHPRIDESSCLIFDLPCQDKDALEMQCRFAEKACPPVIFVCGHSDIQAAVCAMKAGAIELLTKPVNPVALMNAVQAAFARDRKLRQRKAELTKLQERLSLLTPREREVLPLIVGGLLNKQAACVLGISEVTLQIHRSQVMRKMQAESLADLVRMAVKLRIPFWHERPPEQKGPSDALMVGVRRDSNGAARSAVR